MREYINLVEGNQRLDEISKKRKSKIDSMIDSIDSGSTYADVERIYDELPGGIFNSDRNYFLGSVAKKLGVRGMYKPDSAKMGGIVLTKKDENSTRYAETGTAFGLGMSKDNVKALAVINMLPPKRLAKAKEKYPDWDVWKSDSTTDGKGPVDAPAGTDTKGRKDGPDAMKPGADTNAPKDGKLRLSGGETFYRTPDGKGLRLLQKHAGGLVRRMDELVRKMNESVPNSLKSVLSESDRSQLMFEALTADEASELVKVVNDLQLIIDFKDDQGFLISDQNRAGVASRIKEYQPVIDKAKAQLGNTDNSKDVDKDVDKDAKDASDNSNDKGVDKKADKKPVAGNLAKFAKSGKGGLANDPDEVEAIKELQQYLTDLGFDPNGVDGKYGGGTVKAVKEFQKYFGAKEDGDAGPETIGQIVKLRSFMFKGGKTFVDFRKDMSRMEELIKKGGAIKKSTENSSRDFRSLISIVEQSLTEALSDQEKKELTDLIAQYDDVMNDAEFAAAMPKVSYDRYKKIIDDAKKLDQTGQGKKDDDVNKFAKDADITSYVNDGAKGYFRIPDSMRQELGLDTGKPKYVNLTLSKNGKVIFVSHKPNGGSGPTIQVGSAEAKKITDFMKSQGAEFIDPTANKTTTKEPIVVTSADQAQGIFQNPDATPEEIAAAQRFYGANVSTKKPDGPDPSKLVNPDPNAGKINPEAVKRLNGYLANKKAATDQKEAIKMAQQIVADKEAFALLPQDMQQTMKQLASLDK